MEAQITIQKPSGAIQLQALLPNLRTNNVLQVAMLCMVVDLSGLAAYGLAMVDFHKKKTMAIAILGIPLCFISELVLKLDLGKIK